MILARVFTFLSPFLPVVPLTVDYQKRRDPDTFERKRSTERQIQGFPHGSDVSIYGDASKKSSDKVFTRYLLSVMPLKLW